MPPADRLNRCSIAEHYCGQVCTPKFAIHPDQARYGKIHDAATIKAEVRQGIGSDDKALWSMPAIALACWLMCRLVSAIKCTKMPGRACHGIYSGWMSAEVSLN